MEVIVTNKEELKEAMKNKANIIVVEGELAKNIHNSRKIKKIGIASIAIITTALTAATITAPLTGGLSYAAAAPIAASAGVPVATIISLSIVGITVVIALFKDYEEIEYSLTPPSVKFKKKS